MKQFKFRFLLLLGCIMLINSQLMAVPAKHDPGTFKPPDDEKTTLHLKGDANLTPSIVRYLGEQTATRGQGGSILLYYFKNH